MIWLLLFPISAEAQTTARAILAPPETGGFPVIQTFLEVYDGQGNFVHDLREADVTIVEDDHSLPVMEIEEQEVGAQFVVALNLGPTFAIRDVNGISRYDTIQAAFNDWANNHSAPYDDLSFLANDHPENFHLTNPVQWLNEFQRYDSDPRVAVPSLDVLVRAINVAADPVPRVGMGRAILLLTPPPDRTGTAILQSITSLANQEDVRVNVWMVSSQAYFSSEGARQLADLANQTGGQFFAFSGSEEFPDIDDYLDPLRYIYTLSYESKIKNSKPHQIYANIQAKELRIRGEPRKFDLEILPPNPIFLSPPLQIFRANRSALSETLSEEADYTPKEQSLKIMVEFSDGRTRPLARTTLYVDGEIAAENTSPPFDTFTWDLRDYKSSGAHILQVEALDSLGLSNVSIENRVQITVQQTPQSVISTIAQNAPIIAGTAAALAGGILVLVLIVGGRIQPKTFGRRRKKRRSKTTERRLKKDPVTQPVRLESSPQRGRFSTWINRFSWPQRGSSSPKPIAHLEPLRENDNYSPEQMIPISAGEITFGSDPTQATVIINDDAVDKLHTRLKVSREGEIVIFDEGSIAGTWVNFTPVPPEGTRLSHGDIIHIGRIELRLKMVDKKRIPKPVVLPLGSSS